MFDNETQTTIEVDRLNKEKLYIQLARVMLEEIKSGRWPLEEKIPSEDELARRHGVSRITVKQALGLLVADGYLNRIQGKGTFVVSVLPVVGLAMKTQFAEETFGEEVKARKEILSRTTAEPPADVRQYLASGEPVHHILSRRIVGGEPAFLDEWFVPPRELAGVERLEPTEQSLYAVLQEHGRRKIFKVIQTLEVRPVRAPEAEVLGLAPGEPVLVVHRLLMGSDDRPVAYTRILGRGSQYKFRTEFDRIR